MEQHAARRIDAEPGEQLRVTQRQFDHFAQLPDGIADPANVVIVDVCPAPARFLELLAQLDLGILVDMDDALGHGRYHGEADLGQREGGRVEHPRDLRRHVLHLLLTGRRNDIARHQRTTEEIALQRLRRALEAHLALGRGEDDARGGARFGLAHHDMIARANLGIGALQAVEADHFQPFVLWIGQHRAGRGGALADDLQHIALGNPQRRHRCLGQPGNAVAALLLPRGGDLQLDGLVVDEWLARRPWR